jgi:hypothetical protein
VVRRHNHATATHAGPVAAAQEPPPDLAAWDASTVSAVDAGDWPARADGYLFEHEDAGLIPVYDQAMTSNSCFRAMLDGAFPVDRDFEEDIGLSGEIPWWLWWGSRFHVRGAREPVIGVVAGRARCQVFVTIFLQGGDAHTAQWGRSSAPSWALDSAAYLRHPAAQRKFHGCAPGGFEARWWAFLNGAGLGRAAPSPP